MLRKMSIVFLLAMTMFLLAGNIVKVPKITKIAPILNDRIDTMKGTTWTSTQGPTFDKSANGYGWYQGYNKKVQVNHDPVTGPMIGSTYRKLAPTGSGTIGGMTGGWAGSSFQGSAQTAYSSSIYQGNGTNPGGRFPNTSEFINGYLFGIFNDIDLTTGGEISQAMYGVCDATFGWDLAMWSAPKRIEAVNGGATPPAAWLGTGDVVYDPVSGYYYWTTFWSEGLVNDSPFNLVTGRSLTPANMNSWEWTDYNEYDFDASTTTGITDMSGKCVFSYAKDIYGNGTGFGIGVVVYSDDTYQMTDSLGNPLDVSAHPRLGYIYTTNWGAEWVSTEFKPNWQTLGNQGNNFIPADIYNLFDWYNTDLDSTGTVKMDWPYLTWNIDAVTTENNIVHVLAKIVGASTDSDFLYYVNNDSVIAGYYDIVGEITPTGVNWLSANYIAAFMGIDDGNTEWTYSNSHDHSIGYAGNGVVYASWLDRPETRYTANTNPDPKKVYIDDVFFTYSSDNGLTWDIDKTVLFGDLELKYAANITKTSSLHEEGFALASHGSVSGNLLTVYGACQYYDLANPLDPVGDWCDYQQFLKAWKITGVITFPSGSITVTNPNGGEVISQGTMNEITWTDDISENVKIDLYKDGSFYSNIVSSTESDGSHIWIVPNDLNGTTFKIKITSVTYLSIYDISDSTFSIGSGVITVTTPNGGEVLSQSSQYEIAWNDNFDENVKIDLYQDSLFQSVIASSTESDGSYLWTVPGDIFGTDYKIKITSLSDSQVSDMSDNYFAVINGRVLVTSPNGGENYLQNTQTNITWFDNLTENVKIELYQSASLHTVINSSTPSTGTYQWDIPAGLTGSDFQIKVSSAILPGMHSDISDSTFTLMPGKVAVLAPNGLESISMGETYEIKWIDALSENVKIELFKDDAFHSTIISSTESDGSYMWFVSEGSLNGSTFKIKVSSIILPGINNDMSDNNFTIEMGTIALSKPEAGIVLEMYSENLIEWSDNINEDVLISLLKGDSLITSFTKPSTGSCRWHFYSASVTDGSDYKIRIESSLFSEIYSESGLFTIKGTNNVSGSLSGEWSNSGSPYIITGPSSLDLPNTLTLNPGVKVKGAHGNDVLNVQGKLISQGMHNNAIKYSGIDLNFNNSASTDSSKVVYSQFGQNEEYFIYEQVFPDTSYTTQTIRINNNSKVVMQNSRIENINNYGIIVSGAAPAIANNLIANNNGGIKFVNSTSYYIGNNTIADNDSIGLYFDSNSNPMLLNNVVYGNGYNQVYLNDNGSDPEFYYNNIQGGSAGFGLNAGVVYTGSYSGNINSAPLFETGSYNLQEVSPCINSGYPDLTYGDLGYLYIPTKDIAGSNRLNGDIDIGCYEYWIPVLDPSVPENVVISADSVSINVAWDESENANSYLIYSSDDPYGEFTYNATVATNTWSTPLNTETKKFYYIVASTDSGKYVTVPSISEKKSNRMKIQKIQNILKK